MQTYTVNENENMNNHVVSKERVMQYNLVWVSWETPQSVRNCCFPLGLNIPLSYEIATQMEIGGVTLAPLADGSYQFGVINNSRITNVAFIG